MHLPHQEPCRSYPGTVTCSNHSVTGSLIPPPQGQSPVEITPPPVALQWTLEIVSAARSLDKKKVSAVSQKLEKLERLENQVVGESTKISAFEGNIATIKRDVGQSVQKTKQLVEALIVRADFQDGHMEERIVSLNKETKN